MTYENGSLKTFKRFYTAAGSHDTTYNYYADGRLQNMVNANQHTTQFTYDSNGYPDVMAPAAGPKIDTDVDAYGHLERMEILTEGTGASTGRITQFDHNALGWLDRITYADNRATEYQYNGLGYLTQTTDRAGRITDYDYAPTKKLTSVKRYLDPDGANIPVEIAYDYDNWFNSVTITEPRGRSVESYQLDVQDRIEQATNVEGQTMGITYFVGDFVDTVTRFDGSIIANTYDSAGRRNTVTYSPRSPNTVPVVVDYDYYADSQVKSISDTTTTVNLGYTQLNQLNAVTNAIASAPSVTSVVNYQYNPVGNVTNSTVSVGSVALCDHSYLYDAAERLVGLTAKNAKGTQGFDYDYNSENGRVASVSNTVSGITTAYAYDLMDRATNITYLASNGSLIRSIGYVYYEDTSMIKDKVVNDGYQLLVNSYQYDSLDRLVGETASANSAPLRDIQYNYDLAGNRTSVVTVDGIGDPVTNSYTLGTGNRLASWGTNGSALYDIAGNTTNLVSNDGTSLNLSWDERYRLTEVVSHRGTETRSVEYGYDVRGRKISRTETSNTQPQTTNCTYYIYDGNQIVADADASGNLLRSYTYGPGIDNILSVTIYPQTPNSQPQTFFYLKDHQNTVIALTDSSGNVVESCDYDAYGNTKVFNASGVELEESAYGNRYLFQGREYDSVTGLYYFRARWYNPETGRWLSKDPIGIAGGLNLYAFCGDNPVNFVDPFGELWSWAAAGIGAVVGAVGGAFSSAGSQALSGEPIDLGAVAASAAGGAVAGALVGGAFGAATGDPTALIIGTAGASLIGGTIDAVISEGLSDDDDSNNTYICSSCGQVLIGGEICVCAPASSPSGPTSCSE